MAEIIEGAEGMADMAETIGETGSEIKNIGEASEAMSEQEALSAASQEIESASAEVAEEAEAAVKDGMDEVKNDVGDSPDGDGLREKAKKWVVENIWENAKSFGKFAGVEIAKGALFTVGMVAIQKLFEVINKKAAGGTGDAQATAKAYKLSSQLQQISTSLQQVTSDWQLWLAKRYGDRGSYGSVDVEGTTISRFQILQSKVSDVGTVLTEKVQPALKVVNEKQNLASLKLLLTAYQAVYDKAVLVSTDISTKEQKMVSDGLQNNKTALDGVKTALAQANSDTV